MPSDSRTSNADPRPRRALLAGASGLVGSALLKMLLNSDAYSSVCVLARRELPLSDPRLSLRLVDFDDLEELPDFPAVDDVYCCLGTTIRAAGSRAAFRRVDLDYVAELSRTAQREGATRLAVVSAMGADSRSKVFYNRVKGDMETVVCALGYESVTIVRPSLLVGDRTERRTGERIALAIAQPISALIPGRYRPIAASAVARAMVHFQLEGRPGPRVVESGRLQHFVESNAGAR